MELFLNCIMNLFYRENELNNKKKKLPFLFLIYKLYLAHVLQNQIIKGKAHRILTEELDENTVSVFKTNAFRNKMERTGNLKTHLYGAKRRTHQALVNLYSCFKQMYTHPTKLQKTTIPITFTHSLLKIARADSTVNIISKLK